MAEGHEGCSGDCGHCAQAEKDEDCKLNARLAKIRHKIVVMSGKGGVGKSTVAANLAASLAKGGRTVGLLDVDVHGPSIPKMLNLDASRLESDGESIIPAEIDGVKVVSSAFLLPSSDDAVIWRGPMKIGVIRQLISDTEWGELDYLVVDCPPGTGDEPLTVCQLLKGADGAVIVTTPQEVSALDVSKSISFCNKLEFPILGIVENMSGFVCPHCGEVTNIFSSGAGEMLSKKYGVQLLGKIPVDPEVCADGDKGTPYLARCAKSATAEMFDEVVRKISAITSF